MKGELGDVFGIVCAPVCNPNLSCGRSQDGEACFVLDLFANVVPSAPELYVNMILGVQVALQRCTLICLAKLTCLFFFSFLMVQLNAEPKR